jgi:4-amino-4-deoxy-L-arabinose transferase-like glycosyltransferase
VTRLIFTIALFVRVVAILAAGLTTPHFGDAEAYMRTAEAILVTGSYPDNAEALPVFRAPGYPVFLLVSTLGHPRAVAVEKLWNAILGAASAVVLARIAGRISKSKKVAVGAGLIAAVNPAFVYLATDIQSECLTILLLLLSGIQLLEAVNGGRSRHAFGAGVFLGLGALTRPSCLAMAPLLLAPLVFSGERQRLRRSALAVAGLVIAVAPWLVRNAQRFGAFIPINDQFGLQVWLGNTQFNVDYYDAKTREQYRELMTRYKEEVGQGRIHEIAVEHPNPAARSEAFVADAMRWIKKHRDLWVWLMGKKCLDWLRPWASPFRWGSFIVVATGLWYSVLFVLAVVGLFRSGRHGVSVAAVGVLVLSAAIHIATVVSWRYRMVFWDPVLVVFAVLGARAVGVPGIAGRDTGSEGAE